MRLQTERLTLEPARPEHADAVAALWADPDAMRYMGGPRDPEKVRAAVAGGALDSWVVRESGSGAYVGDCYVHDKEGEKEIVYVIAPAFWGRGYATEAAQCVMDHLALPRLTAWIRAGNAASIRVARKLGMEFEREVTRSDGRRMRVFAKTEG